MVSKLKNGAQAARQALELPSLPSAEEIKQLLHLEPLEGEGGFYAETYHAPVRFPAGVLPSTYNGERLAGSAIFYMLTPETFSAMHRLKGDEIYHFYLGDPVEMLMLKPDGSGEAVLLGQRIAEGMRVQHVVLGGTWQGARLAPGGRFALMGTTMAPGFDLADHELGQRQELAAAYPIYSPLITLLTR